MYKSLNINGYKSFEKQTIKSLKPINLIVGENASGKTALLEALFLLASSSPDKIFVTEALRMGLTTGSPFQIHYNPTDPTAIFQNFFHHFQINNPIHIGANENGKEKMTFDMLVSEKVRMKLGSAEDSNISTSESPIPFEFNWHRKGKKFNSTLYVTSRGELEYSRNLEMPLFNCVLLSGASTGQAEKAMRLTKLSKENREDELVRALQHVYTGIEDVSVEIEHSGPVIYAQVKGLAKKIPISLVSSGVDKLVSILLALFANAEDGVLLIDEIENGLYYGIMPKVWELLAKLSVKHNCQIFASTHSYECIQAAARVAEENSGKFALLRTIREEDKTVVQNFGEDIFIGAIKDEREVR